MSESTISVSDQDFETEVLQSDRPVLVDFWAEWCAPCKALGPILDEVATDYTGKMKIAKLNIDHSRDTPIKYGVRSIPTLILFKNGEVEGLKIGSLTKSQLTSFIDSIL